MARLLWCVGIAIVVVCCALIVDAHPKFQNVIPNGNRVLRNGEEWHGVGHASAAGGGDLNVFGQRFKAVGMEWTTEFCQEDSDGDGFTNGVELGDPDCSWKVGDAPMRAVDISHPGFSDSVPAGTGGNGSSTSAPPLPTTAPEHHSAFECTVEIDCHQRASSVTTGYGRVCLCTCNDGWTGKSCNSCPRNFESGLCNKCAPGYMSYPVCYPEGTERYGASQAECDSHCAEGQCKGEIKQIAGSRQDVCVCTGCPETKVAACSAVDKQPCIWPVKACHDGAAGSTCVVELNGTFVWHDCQTTCD